MSDKAFLDTNVIIYLYSKSDEQKWDAACNILDSYDCVTSIQAMNESSNVWFNKFKWSATEIEKHLDNIELVCDEVLTIHRNTINKALSLRIMNPFK